MKEKTSLRYPLSLFCFMLCSAVVYNPLYKTPRPFPVCIMSLLLGLLLSFFYARFFKKHKANTAHTSFSKVLCIISLVCLCLGTVFFISALQNCFAFFSPFYNSGEKGLVFALLLLFICAYSAHRKSDGIFRLCQLVCPLFILYYIILFLAPLSTEILVLPQKNTFFGISAASFAEAMFSGLYLFSDIAVFHFVFDRESHEEKAEKHSFVKTGTVTAFVFGIVMCINRVRASFTFGETLVTSFSFCDLAAIKLLPVFSFPEIYLIFISLSCIVKVSVYIRGASKVLCMLTEKNADEGFKYDSYICAFFCLILSSALTRLMRSFAMESMVFTPFLLLSSFFILSLTFLSSKRQNKS